MPVKLATAPFANIAFVITPFAIAVTFPVEVTTPVKFALVVTVVAVVAVDAFPTNVPLKTGAVTFPENVGESKGAFKFSSV